MRPFDLTNPLKINISFTMGWRHSWKQIRYLVAAFLFFSSFSTTDALDSLPPPCDSYIYCQGPLLHTVQMSEIYNDSKHFVDMSLVNSPNVTFENYLKFMNQTNQKPTQDQVRAFVNSNFLEPSSEFVPWDPTDWDPNPDFIQNIVDPDLEEWASDLNDLWKQLGRKTSDEVLNSPEKYSLIYLPHPVIVPGGRFREIYYWDSYWTMEGLLLSGMHETAKGMLENFIEFVRIYGMVPNGGRIYYTRRTQPPYLIAMVKLYVDYTGDMDFVKANLDMLEKEFKYWEDHRSTPVRDTVTGKVHRIFHYNVQVGGPRPEAYKEDFKLAENLTASTEEEKEKLYVELKSGAESGWDYSTRWFVVGDSNKGDLSDLNVTAIAPVDLNSLLCFNARVLSDFYNKTGNVEKASQYDDIANTKNQTIAELFWDEEDGIWYDLNIHTMKKRKFFYLSNVHPIWGGCYGSENPREATLEKVIDYLNTENVVDYIGGVPTSLKDSGEQWDYPNAWAPLQHLVIMGLYNARALNPDAEPLSFDLAEKWVRSNYEGYLETNAMFEKYDVNVEGVAGQGGEYDVQIGFGWTNGVAMKLMATFGDRLTATRQGGGGSQTINAILPLFVFLPTVILLLLSSLRRL